MRRVPVVGLAVVVCVLLFACGKKEEGPKILEKAALSPVTTFDALLPQDTAFLLYKPDIARYKQRFQESALHAMWTDPNLTDWKESFFLPNWGKLKEAVGFDLDEFFELFQKDVALVIEVPEQVSLETVLPMIYARFGENAEKAKTFLRAQVIEALKQRIPDLKVSDQNVEGETITFVDLGHAQFAYVFLDDLWVLGPTAERVAQVIKRQKQTEANWTSSPTYAAAQKMNDPGADTLMWVNLMRATESAKQLLDQWQSGKSAHQSPEIQKIKKVLELLGLFDMEYLTATSTLKGKGVYSQMKLTFTLPRRGLFGLLEPTKELRIIKMLPLDTLFYTAVSVKPMSDVLAMMKEIGSSIEPETFSQSYEEGSAQVKETLGFGMEEICATIGSEYAVAMEGITPLPLMALLVELRDSEKFNQVLNQIIEKSGIETQQGTHSGVAYRTIPIPTAAMQLCIATCGEYLVLTNNVRQLEHIIDAKASGKYVKPVEEFKQLTLAGNVIEESCSKPTDLAALQPLVFPIVQGFNAQMLRLGQQPVPMNAIPNLAAISDHTFPSVSHSTAEEKALISECYSLGGEELLVVGAAGVAGAMAAIALPNFREANVRATVSRAKSDQRALATAIESYDVDYNHYPLWELRSDFATPRPTFILPRPEKHTGSLTTPIAYITRIFPDPFSADKEEWFSYYTTDNKWIVISAGPDKDYDIVPQQDFQQAGDSNALWNAIVNKTYDPTNGTHSNGDIWRSNVIYY
jgi:type II secretory pathway pseudopilin PulG